MALKPSRSGPLEAPGSPFVAPSEIAKSQARRSETLACRPTWGPRKGRKGFSLGRREGSPWVTVGVSHWGRGALPEEEKWEINPALGKWGLT